MVFLGPKQTDGGKVRKAVEALRLSWCSAGKVMIRQRRAGRLFRDVVRVVYPVQTSGRSLRRRLAIRRLMQLGPLVLRETQRKRSFHLWQLSAEAGLTGYMGAVVVGPASCAASTAASTSRSDM